MARRSPHRCLAPPAAVFMLASAGCSTPAGVVFDAANSAHCWPPPPDDCRIRFVGELKSSADLKPAVGAGDAIGEFFFGARSPEPMVSPLAVCTDGAQRVFIVDSGAQAVHVFDLDTRAYARWAPRRESPTRFTLPVAAAFDPSGRLLVSDSVAGCIFVFSGTGEFLGALGDEALERPCGIVIDPVTRKIYVADPGAHQVVILSSDGYETGRIGERGAGISQFNFPTYLARDSRGRLAVADSLNFRVLIFEPDGTPEMAIGRKGDLPGYFAQPKGLCFDAEDHLYVVDAHFEAVQVFSSEGLLLMAFGREGHAPGEFWLPGGLHVDPKNRIWIADSYNRRVQVFDYLSEATK